MSCGLVKPTCECVSIHYLLFNCVKFSLIVDIPAQEYFLWFHLPPEPKVIELLVSGEHGVIMHSCVKGITKSLLHWEISRVTEVTRAS